MGKRSQRRPVRYEKDHSGCMWGFISMFDFRHGRSTQKFLSDRRRGSRHAAGAVYSKNKFEMLSNLDEAFQEILGGSEGNASTVTGRVDKTSVKKLIEEEMSSDQNINVVKNKTEIESKESSLENGGLLKTNAKKSKRGRRKSHSMDSKDLDYDGSSEFSCNPHLRHSSMDNLDLNKLVEDFCHHNHLTRTCSVKDDQDSEVLPQVNHKCGHIEDKVKRAIEKFVNDTILNGNDSVCGKLPHIELIDRLQVASSDKELLMQLLQDPESFFRKCSQDLLGAQDNKHASARELNSSAKDLDNVKETKQNGASKPKNIFRKKMKSQEKTPSDESKNSEASNRIVILKPLAKGSQNPRTESSFTPSPIPDDTSKSKGPSARSGSHFSLTEIKRKLKYAMGKERHVSSDGKDKEDIETLKGKDNVGRKSPNKDHFFLERIARPLTDIDRREKIGKSKDSQLGLERGAEITSIARVSSSIYAEAKKHLYEMLSKGEDGIEFPGQQIPKPLGRILSFSDYSFSPICSPGRDWEHGFVTSQTRFSPVENLRKTNDGTCSPEEVSNNCVVDQAKQSIESESSLCGDNHENREQALHTNPNLSVDTVHEKVEGTTSVVQHESIIEGKLEVRKETDLLDASSGISFSSKEDDDNCVISNNSEDHRQSESSNQDKFEDNLLSSPSRTSSTTKVEELECTSDVSGRPSPISVLEPAFTEDDVSPKYSKSEPVEPSLQPLRIQFEEQECSFGEQVNSVKLRIEQNKLILDYINAVLEASSLSWDQIWTKCLTSDHILEPCLFDQPVHFPNQLCLDQKLLFDCINEVLMEVCLHNIGLSPWVSFVNPSSKPIINLQRLVLEVWKQVCWYLLPLPLPHTLDQIVRKDMAKSGAWVDRRSNVEDVGVEMGEAILMELMEDTIFSCMTENLESEVPSFQLELMEVIAAPICTGPAAPNDFCPDHTLVANPIDTVKASN